MSPASGISLVAEPPRTTAKTSLRRKRQARPTFSPGKVPSRASARTVFVLTRRRAAASSVVRTSCSSAIFLHSPLTGSNVTLPVAASPAQGARGCGRLRSPMNPTASHRTGTRLRWPSRLLAAHSLPATASSAAARRWLAARDRSRCSANLPRARSARLTGPIQRNLKAFQTNSRTSRYSQPGPPSLMIVVGVFPKKWRRSLCREFVDVSES